MSLSLLEKFDQIMNNLEKDIELTLLKEKMEHMKERRRVAVRKYMKKLRETDEFKEKERLRAKKRYEEHREEILEKQKQSPKDPQKDKRYYAKLKERMETDPELKEKVLEDQRRRGRIYRELVKAKKMAQQLEQIPEHKELGLQLL